MWHWPNRTGKTGATTATPTSRGGQVRDSQIRPAHELRQDPFPLEVSPAPWQGLVAVHDLEEVFGHVLKVLLEIEGPEPGVCFVDKDDGLPRREGLSNFKLHKGAA